MRIGLLSINMYTKGLNFASPLHTYAFQQFLKKHGYESTIIDYKPIYYGDFDLRHPYDYYRALIDRRYAMNNMDRIDELEEKMQGYKAIFKEREIRHDKFQSFIAKHYDKTKDCYNSDLLEVKDPGCDCYICVTDVIWKNEPGHGFDRGFFLGSKTMENKWKIAYSASRGVYFAASGQDKQLFFHYLDDIDFISVRERSLKEYIQTNSDEEAAMVLDPVLLHDRSFYERIAIESDQKDYLFLYYVMEKAEDTIEQAISYARAHDLTIVEVTDLPLPVGRLAEYDDIDVVYRYDVGIEEWLGYLMNARAVFTNSFHATCLSCIFEKEVFIGARDGDKVTNFIEMLGISHRRLDVRIDVMDREIEPIDYDVVQAILNWKREESKEFILGAIEFARTHERPYEDYTSWQKELTYPIIYRLKGEEFTSKIANSKDYEAAPKSKGAVEYTQHDLVTNNGCCTFRSPMDETGKFARFKWRLKFKIDNMVFVLLKDGSFVLEEEYWKQRTPLRTIQHGDKIPFIAVNRITYMFAEPVKNELVLRGKFFVKSIIEKVESALGKK